MLSTKVAAAPMVVTTHGQISKVRTTWLSVARGTVYLCPILPDIETSSKYM